MKTIQVFNNVIGIGLSNAKQYQANLAKQLEPIYATVNNIDSQFSQGNTNREHYKLPPYTKPQTQPSDEEINKESITIIMKTFEAEAENIKKQM